MAAVCEICGKGVIVGRSSRHKRGVAGKRWRKRAQKTVKVFRPNITTATLLFRGKQIKLNLCAKCLKRVKKDSSEGKLYRGYSTI